MEIDQPELQPETVDNKNEEEEESSVYDSAGENNEVILDQEAI